jgi:hypothetical protein
MQERIALKRLVACIVALLAAVAVVGCSREPRPEGQESYEARLQRLEDREEIRQLTMDYGRFLDQRDWASFSQLFAEKEGEWTGGMGSAKGSQAVRKLMEDTIGQSSGAVSPANFHIFTNQVIHPDGDRATAATKWMFVVQGADNRPQTVFLGHYEDSMVRENGRWKFLRRVVHGDIPSDRK